LSRSEFGTYARLLAMTDTRRLDTVLVNRALAAKWRPLRAAAALAIGQVGATVGMPGAPRLRALLDDRDVTVAANAAYALGLLRDTASVRALSEAVRKMGAAHEVSREAAWALGEIGASARDAITSALSSHPTDHDTMIQLLLAAAKMRVIPIAEIRPYLHEGHPSVVWAAAYAIARNHAASGARDLIALDSAAVLRDRSRAAELAPNAQAPYLSYPTGRQRIRAEIARELSRSAAGDSLGAAAYAVLGRLAHDDDPHVRINALRSLGTYGPRARDLIVAGTRDADANVRIAAAQSLGTVLSRGEANWSSLWAADTSLAYRASLLASATRAGLRPAELSTWAQATDWRMRAAVASAAGDTADRAFALTRALPLTRDADPRVRAAAYDALVPPASMAFEDSVHALLISALNDPDFYARATVLSILSRRPAATDLPAVLDEYHRSATDTANDARLAAVQYFGALWKKDSLSISPDLRAALAALPAPKDPLERNAARGFPLLAGWSAITEPARPLSFYEGVLRAVLLPVYGGHPPRATIHTVRGDLRLELFGADAPITVNNFLALARTGFYRNTRFHRVVPNFVIQDGDPRDDGNGGPGYEIRDEMNRNRYERGALGMALSGPDTGGSQYFITHSPQPHLDGHYTVFGRLIGGYDVLDKIVQGDRITSVEAK
jgi:cyclophilin family peptidyl-prolyl cis-trans isomerase/HEAT repeat protein